MQLRDLFLNTPLIHVAIAWILAQGLKPIIYWFTRRKWDWHWLYSPGGMPSAHSAAVSSLATSVGLREGFSDSTFAVALVTAIVVLYDAAGVRRAASIQAHILNQILKELFSGHPIGQEHLKELIGHTPFEVVMGATLGVTTSVVLYIA